MTEEDKAVYKTALEACKHGVFTKELRKLYNYPLRDKVPWDLFPNWARPSDPVEGGHEGGAI